jgi:ribosomal protein S1
MGAAKNLKPGYKASAPVTEISSEGIYLELMQHVDGFIPKATLEAKNVEPAIGDTLEYVIDKFRKEDRVFELSLV